MENKFVNSNKLAVFFQSAKKQNPSIVKEKKKWITFVGKLNKAKGYDIFAESIKKILNTYPNWKAKIIGDEKREKIKLDHENANLLGFLNHEEVLKIFRKSSIALHVLDGKTPLVEPAEASANGCAVIITNKGGLPETITNAKILRSLTTKELTKEITNLIRNEDQRKKLQSLSIKNF